MAFPAVHRFVFTLQFETGQIMVEVTQGTRHPEGLLRVAFSTVAAEFALVCILVADGTLVCLHTQPVLKNSGRAGVHLMAAGTIHLPVLAFQREMGAAVVESFDAAQGSKGLFGMALFTIRPQVIPVRIGVATVAVAERHI